MSQSKRNYTAKQSLGEWGEKFVAKNCNCPRCKKPKTLKLLPPNFKCADLICDFCGYLAQVKATEVKSATKLPSYVNGAKWTPQKDRMDAGIYFPLFLVLKDRNESAIYYLPTDFQNPSLFLARTPLSATAQKKGWQGFRYVLNNLASGTMVRLL